MKVRKEGRGWGEPCGVLILFLLLGRWWYGREWGCGCGCGCGLGAYINYG